MLFKYPKNYAYLFLLLLGLISCDAIDDIMPDKKDTGVISAMLNGAPFEAEGGKGLLASEFIKAELDFNENNYLLTVYGIRIEDNKTVLAVGFQLAGKDIKEVKAGDTFTEWILINESTSTFEGAKGAVEKRNSIRSDDNVFKASTYYTGEMSLTISQIDLEEQKISGTFMFSAVDSDNDTLVNVTGGAFEQVQWKVL
ncbi:DUF6252 family protein [Algoriphagus sp. D3-2-R+10]|uniref:DUF6252 family protein n=1 Tax=Algoriphagus aurantiacus TaxID=3103948 RepID=UPI002B3E0906|nr:DUF6252 family protein [Algoriphagus sp. D3-2-R+10]MEB2775764.1 DUF6252 family protein [Algoriphagus sp. D3-2-R+10]